MYSDEQIQEMINKIVEAREKFNKCLQEAHSKNKRKKEKFKDADPNNLTIIKYKNGNGVLICNLAELNKKQLKNVLKLMEE